jgi:hypothetical protein
MSYYFVDNTGGDDANDGKDHLGFGLSGATFNGAGNKRLTAAGSPFADYTPSSQIRRKRRRSRVPDGVQRDIIYLTSGGTEAWYNIAQKISGSELALGKLRDGTALGDVTDATSSSGPFETIQKAFDSVSPSSNNPDTIWIAEFHNGDVSVAYTDQAYPASSIIDISTAGLSDAYVFVRGFSSAPGDGGTPILDAAVNNLDYAITTSLTGSLHYFFENIEFANANITGAEFGTNNHITFSRCRFSDNLTWGLNALDDILIVGSSFFGNGSVEHGIPATATDGGANLGRRATITDSAFQENIGAGVQTNTPSTLMNNLFIANSVDQYSVIGIRNAVIMNCTFDGNDKESNVGINHKTSNQKYALYANNVIKQHVRSIQRNTDDGAGHILVNNTIVNNTNNVTGNFASLFDTNTETLNPGSWL